MLSSEKRRLGEAGACSRIDAVGSSCADFDTFSRGRGAEAAASIRSIVATISATHSDWPALEFAAGALSLCREGNSEDAGTR